MFNSLQKKIEEVIGEIHSVNKLDEQGCTSEVRRMITENGSYLIKSAFKDKYRTWLREEAQVLAKLKQKNWIPVPTYYDFIEEKDSCHLIMSFENGITLTAALNEAPPLEKKQLVKNFGQFLHQLHEKKLIDSFRRNHDWLERQLKKAQTYVDSGQTEGSFDLLKRLKTDKPMPIQQTMIHGDCTTDNVLVMDGKVQLFIDVAGMTVGDPRYDISLATRKFVDQPEYLEAFYQGYTRYKLSKDEFQYFNDGLYEFF